MEDINLEDEKVPEKTAKEKFLHFFNIMTIEPMMFLQGLAWSITSIAYSQMILYKTCRGEIFIMI